MNILQEIYELTEELIVSIKRNDCDDIEELVSKRAILVKNYLDSQETFSTEELELISKIKMKKNEIIELLKQQQLDTGIKLKKISSNSKAVAAYKIMKNIQPVFFNEKDI